MLRRSVPPVRPGRAICACHDWLVAQAPFRKLFKKLFESFKECQDHPPYAAATPLETTRPRRTPCVLARTVEPETYETDVTARKPRSENARGLTTVGEAWDYMEQVHHAYH